AGEGVVDQLKRAVRVQGFAEIAGSQRGVRYVEEREEARRPFVALERSEEEQLVLLDRPAERGAVVVHFDWQVVRRRAGVEPIRLGVQFLIVEVLERRPAEAVRAGFRDN